MEKGDRCPLEEVNSKIQHFPGSQIEVYGFLLD